MPLQFQIKPFSELTLEELYSILRLRAQVFVVEQNCVYQDMDGKDKKALHVLGKKEYGLIGYARCFPPGAYFEEAAIGRVLIDSEHRKYGYGHQLLDASIKAIEGHFGTSTIKLSAQTYLTRFYEAHGFKKIGGEYLEDGIPHTAMLKS